MKPWAVLESVPGLLAAESEWRRHLGEAFPAFEQLCLVPAAYRVRRVPCPRHCGCDHLVVPRHGQGAIGVCTCTPASCPDLALAEAEVTTLEASLPQLGQALCKAFSLATRQASLGLPGTLQVGAWSVAVVPVILTVQFQASTFHAVVAELVSRLRQPFILFAPTTDFLDARGLALLRSCGAACFALRDHLTVADSGALRPKVAPGELLTAFTPQPKEIDLDAVSRAFALVRKLDTDKPLPPPSLLTVFRLYCVNDLSYAQIARHCDCSKTAVVRRVALLRRRTGLDLLALRRMSAQIVDLEEGLKDPRARRVRRAEQAEGA